MSDTRRYLGRLLALAGGLLLAAAGLNLAVDPFGVFAPWSVPGWAPYKRNLDTRVGRAELARLHAGETMFIGTSRTAIGYDPESPHAPAPAVNLGLPQSNIVEAEAICRYAIDECRAPRIVLGLDFFMFSTTQSEVDDFAQSRFNPNLPPAEHYLDHLIGWRTTHASLNALDRIARQRPRFTARGHRVDMHEQMRGTPEHRLRFIAQQFLGSLTLLKGTDQLDARLECFRGIVTHCRDRDVELIVVINPVHALQLETVQAAGLWPQYEAWKRGLAAIVAAESPATPLWDFTGYAGYPAEPISFEGAGELAWFWEPSHFKSALGEKVLARVFERSAAEPGFGVRLGPENIERHLAQTRLERAAWLVERRVESQWHARVAAEILAARRDGPLVR